MKKKLSWYMLYSDKSEIDNSAEIIRIPYFHLSQKLWRNTVENYRNCFVAEKRIVSKLTKLSLQNFNSTNWILEWRLCHNPTSLFLYTFREKKPWKSDSGGAGSSFKKIQVVLYSTYKFIYIFPIFSSKPYIIVYFRV